MEWIRHPGGLYRNNSRPPIAVSLGRYKRPSETAVCNLIIDFAKEALDKEAHQDKRKDVNVIVSLFETHFYELAPLPKTEDTDIVTPPFGLEVRCATSPNVFDGPLDDDITDYMFSFGVHDDGSIVSHSDIDTLLRRGVTQSDYFTILRRKDSQPEALMCAKNPVCDLLYGHLEGTVPPYLPDISEKVLVQTVLDYLSSVVFSKSILCPEHTHIAPMSVGTYGPLPAI